MRTLLFSLLLIAAFSVQAQKPTGGCGFRVTITGIDPASSPYILHNGQSYTAKGTVDATGCDGGDGKVEAKLGNIVLGIQEHVDGWGGSFEVPITLANVPVGSWSMEVLFMAEGECMGTWATDQGVLIRDSVKTDTAQTHDSVAVKPPVGGELVIYPVPASGYISINGLRPTETSWAVTVTNADGRPVPMPAGKLLNGVVTISTLHLPQGRSFLHFQTRERTVGGTIEILR